MGEGSGERNPRELGVVRTEMRSKRTEVILVAWSPQSGWRETFGQQTQMPLPRPHECDCGCERRPVTQ